MRPTLAPGADPETGGGLAPETGAGEPLLALVSNLFSLVDTVMGVLVVYGMGARWSPSSASSDPEAMPRR